MNNTLNQRLTFALSLILLATLSRIAIPPFLSHLPNFSALNAIALFSGAYLIQRRSAIVVTLLAVFISDLFINRWLTGNWMLFYPGFYWQYLTYVLIALLGSTLTHPKPMSVLTACLSSTLLFFLISNLGVWFQGILYPATLDGLVTCFIAALPFLKNSLLGDLSFTLLLFGSMEWICFKKQTPSTHFNN